MRTPEEVIKRLNTITQSLNREGTENNTLMKVSAIRELEWVLGLREK